MQLSTQQGSGIDHLSQSRGTIDYSAERIEAAKRLLPEDPRPYADIYFLRTLDILKAKKLNPWVVGQVMVRKGPGQVGGIDEALAIIDKYSDLKRHGGRVYALQDGDFYQPGDTVLRLEGPIQDIVALETMYLGVISGETTRLSEGLSEIDLRSVQDNAKKI
ncbi:MAG: hypothetical protein DCC75_12045, partial [Proteobacteria bacterium]